MKDTENSHRFAILYSACEASCKSAISSMVPNAGTDKNKLCQFCANAGPRDGERFLCLRGQLRAHRTESSCDSELLGS